MHTQGKRCVAVITCLVLLTALTVPGQSVTKDSAANPFESQTPIAQRNAIDQHVFAHLAKLGIPPANGCSDAVFVRRVYLDVIGTLPNAQEARDFILDRQPDKRRRLIDRLLARDEFSDYWAMKWSDILRIKAEFPINLWPNAAQAYHRWLRTSLKNNLPYDQFARELLTASGSNFRCPPVNFYRAVQSHAPRSLAQTVALVFMGTRADQWPTNQWDGMAAFFSRIGYKSTLEWKEEIIFFDSQPSTATNLASATFPDGTPAHLSPDQDPREAFANWLIQPGNPWFNQAIVNRIWAWLCGRGIIHEPDDIRSDNAPVIPELLKYLEHELVASQYDLKHIYRLILNSQTYQLSSIPNGNHPKGETLFAHYEIRRMEAEVLIDALNQITGSTEKYSSAIPEPFTFMPENQRAIALPDGSITSPFLELFGKSPRDTGMYSERNNRTTAAQRLHILNSSQIQRKLEQSRNLQLLAQTSRKPREVAISLYLTILSRYPTPAELNVATNHINTPPGKRRENAQDLTWALINSAEFLHRH